MISLAYAGHGSIELDPDLYWSDENQYSPVEMTVDPSITGALIVQTDGDADRPGRPITLEPEDDGSAWMYRANLDQLNAWGAVAGAVFTLTINGTARSVMFRHQDKPAIDAKPVVFYNDVVSTDFYLVKLKFMEI